MELLFHENAWIAAHCRVCAFLRIHRPQEWKEPTKIIASIAQQAHQLGPGATIESIITIYQYATSQISPKTPRTVTSNQQCSFECPYSSPDHGACILCQFFTTDLTRMDISKYLPHPPVVSETCHVCRYYSKAIQQARQRSEWELVKTVARMQLWEEWVLNQPNSETAKGVRRLLEHTKLH